MASKLRTVIVDDEPLARERLARLLASEPQTELIGEYADGIAAAEAIPRHSPDIVFIDVQMPGADGLTVISEMPARQRPAVIFVTAHEQFALGAFEVGAVDYLLKPFDQERFRTALARAAEHVRARNGGERPPADRLTVRADGKLVFLRTSEIEWAEAADNYIILHLAGRRLIVRETLAAFESRLGGSSFLRVNRSALVHRDQLKEVQPAAHGDHVAILRDGTRLPLSRGLRSQLADILNTR